MKKLYRVVSMVACSVLCAGMLCGCGAKVPSGTNDEQEPPVDLTNAITLTADFQKIVDPPLLKKIAMYNAGCIQPLTNYERDFERIRELNADALRIDLSLGKSVGTAGQYLVSDDYDYTNYDEASGTYEVVKESLKYDFEQLDEVVQYMTDNKVLPYMSWSYIPYPLQENGKWNDLDQNITNWTEIWEEVYYQYAKHYADAGVKIGYHEIYNEPDLEILKCWDVFDESFDGFLNWEDFCLSSQCAPGKGVYPDMYEYGAKGILRADPDATIGGPAFALGEIGVEDWVGFLPRVINQQLPLDFYSFHTYLDGNTWFMSDEDRAAGNKNEIEKVVSGLAANSYFLKTAVHINEFSYLNDANGSTNGLNSPFNYYEGAWQTIDGIMEIVNRTSVQWVYWAQFMESTGGYDPYGLIEHVNGNVKAAFNALKIYNDMPVWRYEASLSSEDSGLQTLVSSSDDKIGILIWNTNATKDAAGNKITTGDRVVDIKLNNANFAEGTRRVYRIDENNASYFDNNENAELVASAVEVVNTGESIWAGNVPAGGVVYVTINRDGQEDFTAWEKRTEFADDVKTSYYYEDRYRGLEGSRETYSDYVNEISGSYAHFDRSCWTMYLGMGDSTGIDGKYVGQASANGSVIFRELPENFKITLNTDGELKRLNANSTLGVRIDFYDEEKGEYTKSVFFHNGFYSDRRDPNSQDSKLSSLPYYPWGTQDQPDQVVAFEGNVWEIDLMSYAPDGWDCATGKAQISFEMRNTGENTRATFQLSK